MYIHLFHGRPSPDTQMEGWGVDGPVLGPFKSVHMVYGTTMLFDVDGTGVKDIGPVLFYEDLVYYDGIFYGDFEVVEDDNDLVQPGSVQPLVSALFEVPVLQRVTCCSCGLILRLQGEQRNCSQCGSDFIKNEEV